MKKDATRRLSKKEREKKKEIREGKRKEERDDIERIRTDGMCHLTGKVAEDESWQRPN